VGRLVCASNVNNVLFDFIRTGRYDARRDFVRTSSPSMDILVSSNLERLLFIAADGDTEAVRGWMNALSTDGVYSVDASAHKRIRGWFSAGYADESATRRTIARVWAENAYLCDPHTAVAMSVLDDYRRSADYTGAPCVVLSTASPFKFPAVVLDSISGSASGDEFDQMEELSDLSGLPIPKNLASLRSLPELHRTVVNGCRITSAVRDILSEEAHRA